MRLHNVVTYYRKELNLTHEISYSPMFLSLFPIPLQLGCQEVCRQKVGRSLGIQPPILVLSWKEALGTWGSTKATQTKQQWRIPHATLPAWVRPGCREPAQSSKQLRPHASSSASANCGNSGRESHFWIQALLNEHSWPLAVNPLGF